MQAFSIGKMDQDKFKFKGILHNKTTGDCTYRYSWTQKNNRIER
jgi:hypothetical protein